MTALWYSEFCALQIRNFAEPWCLDHIGPTMAGDIEAAFSLLIGLQDYKRGPAAVLLWQAKIPRPAFRVFLQGAWEHDHRYLIDAAGTRRRLRAMFRYADFPKPGHLPDTVTLWRGTSKLAARESARGLAWTTNRDCACWFAVRFADRNGHPLVLRAEVPRESIALFTEERGESEAVVFGVSGPVQDGDPQDWRAGYARYGARKSTTEGACNLAATA